MIDVTTPIVGCNWLVDGNNIMMSIEGDLVSLMILTLTSIMTAWDWWYSSIEAWLIISLSGFLCDDELKCLDYVIVRLCLIWNGIRLVNKYICSLLWHGDDIMLISHIRVAMKGYSDTISNELMTMTIQRIRPYDLH